MFCGRRATARLTKVSTSIAGTCLVVGALEVPDDRRWCPGVCGIGRGPAPLACQRPASQVAGRPPGLSATAHLKPERDGRGEVVAGQVAARGQQARAAGGIGNGGYTAEVERNDVDVGDNQ